jgi:hypothetical protein
MLFLIGASAQDGRKFKVQQWAGHLEGETGSAFQINTIFGMQSGSNFIGLGSGIDWYFKRSIPVYLSFQRILPLGGGRFFAKVDAGLNYAWETPLERSRWNDFISDKFYPSIYAEAGLGYKSYFKNKRDALLFHIGYNFKRLKENKESPSNCFLPPCSTLIEHYDYQLNRVSLKVGWEF